ncbi:putative family metal ion transporter [Erysiphe neolycopersici]|uniref:Putative family metal ion transporter n=1 Tax=Erysiphe neolycopersici TaxID=212602 RepID=A0A420I7G3_9PEZI|nr:putative family metal ion transporter [Erysiphe neolycopersici]
MSSTIPPQDSDPLSDYDIEGDHHDSINLTEPERVDSNKEPLSTSISRSIFSHDARNKRRKNHRAGKLNRQRKKSIIQNRENLQGRLEPPKMDHVESSQSSVREIFYRVKKRNRRGTESEALSDCREQASLRRPRSTAMGQNAFGVSFFESLTSFRHQLIPAKSYDSDSEGVRGENERSPLIKPWSTTSTGFGPYNTDLPTSNRRESLRKRSSRSSALSSPKVSNVNPSPVFSSHIDGYNVNYPPSIPVSPVLEPGHLVGFGDILAVNNFGSVRNSSEIASDGTRHEHIRNVDHLEKSSQVSLGYQQSNINSLRNEERIRFPQQEYARPQEKQPYSRNTGPRRRRGKWPDLGMLDEWSRFEEEGASNERRAKKITEPQLIGGRLRPIHRGWHRAEDDAPYRFTYFNEHLQSTIHSQTISELVQPGSSFRELFIPDPPELSDSSDSACESDCIVENNAINPENRYINSKAPPKYDTRSHPRDMENFSGLESLHDSGKNSGTATPVERRHPNQRPGDMPELNPKKPKRYGNCPIWWLDILSPTDAEMKVLSTTFDIHPLTVEDILMQEAREKVELFRNYYFVNYRSFEQDTNNEDYLNPLNMYVVVFREGVISFHFSLTPHPANVRRRIRQLKDYQILTSDWISYAIIDDITDVFFPLIQNIEDEVDNIDDAILKLHTPISDAKSKKKEKFSEVGDGIFGESGGDMLRRVGDCRKKVMGLYRLLGNKADVIKGFAKRCNENWQIAPRSEIGLYLGDIQDHIVTMTGNLTHYEKILARSHGNYLAQINIRMNERQEQTADVLGKLTVLGTIVIPMNIITGLWGMNVGVPGQDPQGDLTWFWCLTASLLFFGLTCFMIAKVLYHIV